MRVPVSWLRDFVAWRGSVEELAELLSMSGTETEAIEWVGAPRDPENLALFRVGRVVTRAKHPNADKLSLCTVDVGEAGGGVHQIVCGADNFAAGDTVAVSLAGATLENGLKLRKANLRGIESDGMMLSEAELGFEQTSPGIVVLPSAWPVGAPLADYLPISEAVLDLEVTPNRPDCLSIYGIAREVAAVAGLSLAPPPLAEAPTSGAPASDDVVVEVAAPRFCPRYGARVIRGVAVAESPAWLKARLTHAGMRPINNVVDVTNYVMLALGQPLHAFDLTKIGGRKLVVRRALPDEPILTLDEVTRTLSDRMLVIADAQKPLVIAGVFGSVDAEVDERTRDLVLEAATFDGPNILNTSKVLGLRTEASSRFEKGLDPASVPQGLAMACRLFHELCGGAVAPGTIDVRGDLPAPRCLRYRPTQADALLGLPIPADEQGAILKRLECVVEPLSGCDDGKETEECLLVTPPTFRPDLERPVDLVEEVGRVHGLGQVPSTLPARREAVGGLTKAQRVRRLIRRSLVDSGLDEVVTYSFIGPNDIERLGLAPDDRRLRAVALANPMSAEQSVMRTTLLSGMLLAVRDNLAVQNFPLHLFEQGRAYLPATAAAASVRESVALPDEPEALGMVLCGPQRADDWTAVERPTDFFTIKGLVERLLAVLRLGRGSYEPSTEPYLHPGQSADVSLDGVRLGAIGLLRPDIASAFGIEEREVYVGELSVDLLSDKALPPRLFEDLVTYPSATQDLAVVVDRSVPAAQVVALVEKAGGKVLRRVRIFDVYEGDPVPEGKRSLALRLVMRSPERTLSEKDIGAVRRKVLGALERDLGATLR